MQTSSISNLLGTVRIPLHLQSMRGGNDRLLAHHRGQGRKWRTSQARGHVSWQEEENPQQQRVHTWIWWEYPVPFPPLRSSSRRARDVLSVGSDLLPFFAPRCVLAKGRSIYFGINHSRALQRRNLQSANIGQTFIRRASIKEHPPLPLTRLAQSSPPAYRSHHIVGETNGPISYVLVISTERCPKKETDALRTTMDTMDVGGT